MPVLAKQAIRGAAGIIDGQVMEIRMMVTFTYPVGDAVGWQRITVPMQ
jgi:hypothetical protein